MRKAPHLGRQLCEEKNFLYMGTGQVVMPENYIAMFQVPKPSTAQKIIQNAEPDIERIIGFPYKSCHSFPCRISLGKCDPPSWLLLV